MNSFIKIANLVGVDLSFIYDGTINIHFGQLPSDGDGTTIAVAWGSENDESVHIEVDPDVWERMSVLERTATMYHELAHDILNASHNKEVDGHLMHPYNQFNSITELVEAVVMIMEEYQSGTMKVFGPDTDY